ncbi:NPR2 [Branchiostoma lanceolatum]|uniref:guanylate cyclase n=1 Tax=Branchiostoma lanceolatum TaxID=7740 RepID=A0A8K0A7S7_BRALA|nr:NPR2 [Branchiostoma lanceolatum]
MLLFQHLLDFVVVFVLLFLSNQVVQGSNKRFTFALVFPEDTELEAVTEVAVDNINYGPGSLPNITFNYEYRSSSIDGKCDAFYGMTSFFSIFLFGPSQISTVGLIGVKCEDMCKVMPETMTRLKIPFISPFCSSPTELSDKTKYQTFARTTWPPNKTTAIYTQVVTHFGWTKVVVVASQEESWQMLASHLTIQLPEREIQLVKRINVELGASRETLKATLREAATHSQIIILCVSSLIHHEEKGADERRLMLAAHELGMTDGTFVFLTLERKPITDLAILERAWRMNDTEDEKAREAYVSVMRLGWTLAIGCDLMEFQKRVNDKMPDLHIPKKGDDNGHKTVEDIDRLVEMSNLYNAVQLLYQSLLRTFAPTLIHSDGREGRADEGSGVLPVIPDEYQDPNEIQISKNMRNMSFIGFCNETVYMDEDGDRVADYALFHHSVKQVRMIAQYNKTARRFYSLVGESYNYWPGGVWPPKDELPESGPTIDSSTIVAATTTSLLVVTLAAFAVFFIIRKKMVKKEVWQMMWKINYEELTFIDPSRNRHVTRRKYGSRMSYTSRTSRSSASSHTYADPFCSSFSNDLEMVELLHDKRKVNAAHHKNSMVAVKHVPPDEFELTPTRLYELFQMSKIRHENLTPFVGACVDAPNICTVMELCTRGSLQDILHNDDIKLSWNFKSSFITDIVKGMDFLHRSALVSHGNLKSSNCVIDSRWMLKITDYGEMSSGSGVRARARAEYAAMLWTAPEHLREPVETANKKGTQKGDVYSFGVILQEIFVRGAPYCMMSLMTPQDIIERVKARTSPLFRPWVRDAMVPRQYISLMEQSWEEDPEARPEFSLIDTAIGQLSKGQRLNIVDHMFSMLESYTNNLEDLVHRRTEELRAEKHKTDLILYRMLPRGVADNLKAGLPVNAEAFETVTICHCNVINLSSICSELQAMEVIDLMNDLYNSFDEVFGRYDVNQLDSVADASTMVVSGLPVRNGNRHAGQIATMALDLVSTVCGFSSRFLGDRALQIRLGMHTGPVVAGVVGFNMPRYSVFGDTVGVALTMETTGEGMKIQASEDCANILLGIGGFRMVQRGDVDIKGGKSIKTYWIYAKDGFNKPLPDEIVPELEC